MGPAMTPHRRSSIPAANCSPQPRGTSSSTYDFVVYAFLAGAIGHAFFPAGSEIAQLLASFAAFGAGFLARPVGALLIGRVADRQGRRAALLFAVFGMAAGTVGIGLLPTFDTIGSLAPVLLVTLRLVQGLCAGGGWGTSAAFVIESAPEGRRGLYGAIAQACITSSTLLGSLVVAGTHALAGPEQVDRWAWRIPFLLGAALIPVGFFIRRHVVETPAFRRAIQQTFRRVGRREAFRMMASAFGFTAIWTVSFYLMLSYMPTFTSRYGGLAPAQALWLNAAALVVLIALIPFFGWVSDRVGRKPLLLVSCLGFAVLSYPLLRLIAEGARLQTILAVQIVLNLFLGVFSGAGPAALAEIFPTHARTTLLSTGYSLSTAVFGGFAPFVATWLIALTGSPVAPTLYLTSAAVISGAVISCLRETAFEALA